MFGTVYCLVRHVWMLSGFEDSWAEGRQRGCRALHSDPDVAQLLNALRVIDAWYVGKQSGGITSGEYKKSYPSHAISKYPFLPYLLVFARY